ncbi:MAG TPA: hypothetical protein VJ994_11120, partial [Paracoccaceae bacterium]|nr:hypothetical protein [Paracoccaceae bacterium]
LFASLASFDGPDAAAMRHHRLTADGVDLRVMEETTRDSETWHTDERVDVFAIEGAGLLTGEAWALI